MIGRKLIFALTVLLAIGPACARAGTADEPPGPPRLVNVDTPATVTKGTVGIDLDIRTFDHPEDIVYSSLNFRYGLLHDLEVGFRGVTGTTKNFTAGNGSVVRHGGRDAEFYGKYDFGNYSRIHFAILGGVSFPSTPAQSQSHGTVSGVGEIKLHDRVTGYVNPRAIFIDSNTIFGIGLGTSVKVSDKVHIVGDWTGIASGENTRSTADGSRKKGDVWGVALRFATGGEGGKVDFDLGWGNATGSTTGFSLTPGLGNSSGFYFAIHARR